MDNENEAKQDKTFFLPLSLSHAQEFPQNFYNHSVSISNPPS